VNDDEEQLVGMFWFGTRPLQLQKLVERQV
jgi:hypothetical protein